MMSQDKVSEQVDPVQTSQGQILKITLLASEWKSSAGGLSTLNRELAIHLAQMKNVRVSLLVPEGACNDEDKREARSFGISILEARKCVGLDPLVWLSNPPQDHKIDVIVGHGVKLGCQVQLIKRQAQYQNCKWVHVVHTAPEELSKYKGYGNPISRGEKKHWDEVDLCKEADLVVPVGPKLGKAYHSYLQECKKDEDFFELIPGLFDREFADLSAKQNPKEEKDDFIVLLCGRGDEEDFEVKGYNIAVEAFADQWLRGKHYSLLFVGSPEGKQDEVRERLLKCGIDRKLLTVREFVKSREKMKELFCEVDMVIMPSKSEGFGLVALEALSAGLPILVGSNSGFARAIDDIAFGSYSTVDSEVPAKWAEAIQGVRDRHRVVLEESKILKEHYSKKYCWKKQCEELIDRLWKMVYGKVSPLIGFNSGTSTAQAIAADDWEEKQPKAIPESFYLPGQRTFQHDMGNGASNSWSQNAKKLGKRRISESNAEHGMDTKVGKIQRSEQQLPSVSSETFIEPHSARKSKITEEERALATHGNKKYLGEFGENLIKLLISPPDLNEEQLKAVHTMLSVQVKTYLEVHDHSTDKLKGVGALTKFITETYRLLFKDVAVGSLIIVLNCQMIESLEHLWNDYLSGHLDKVAERYLVTDEMKKRLNLQTINLKTTIEEENYLNCRKVLMDCSGEAERTPLFSQQGVLDQETSMIGKATAEVEVFVKQEDKDWLTRTEKTRVKKENTDWMIRMEKAGASRSALHKASVNGQYEEVKKYLSSGCAADLKDQFLLTPLHLACWYGQESVVKLLLEHGADVNATDRFQFTPLHKAERRNHQSIVKLLLDHKARPTFQQPPSLRTLGRRAFTRTDEHSGFNLLQAAVLQGDGNTVEKLSNHLENFVEEMNCRTTGDKASIFPGKSAADILSAFKERKKSHALIGKIYKEFYETDVTLTELHSCAKRNDVEMVIELVLNDGMDVNVAAKRNITALLWASSAASSLSIKTLIDLGADVNTQTFQGSSFGFCGSTALDSAIHGNNVAVVNVLLANNADVNIFDQQGNTLLHSSTFKRFFYISQLLIESGAEINVGNNNGETPLYCAVLGKNVADVKLLLKKNADANIRDTSGNTPLHISLAQGFSNISQLLIDSGCKINGRNNSGETPLYSSVRAKNVADVELLLKNNADANLKDTSGKSPLHISTREGLSNISKWLIDYGCEINGRSFMGETPLYSAVRGKNVADVELLLKNNADANIQDSLGNSPLHLSIPKGFSDITRLLIASGCEVTLRNSKGETPLYCAVRGKNVADVKLLLKNNADANIQDTSGNTPLHISTLEGFSNISPLLIDSGCKINGRNSGGETPLYCAVRGKNVADVELLLKNNADANIQDTSGNTPLHISTFEGFSNISQLLIDSGCKINGRSFIGGTPLHSAAHGKNVADVGLLLKNNADANMQDALENTPLHISTRKGFSNISQLLIESGCKINGRGFMGETPLHSAVRSKNVADVKLLLKNNADGNIQDIFGNAPLHISLGERFWNISQLLIDSGCNKNLKNRVGRTPLEVEPFSLRFGGDLEEDKGNNRYASLKSFRERIVCESEGSSWMNQRTLSTRSFPIVGKRREQSLTEWTGDGGDLEGDKGNNRYASLKSSPEKIVVESEDVPLMNTRTRPTPSLPIAGMRREQSSTEGSSDGRDFEEIKGNNGYESVESSQSSIEWSSDDSDFEEDKGNNRYESVKSFQEKIVVESEDVPLMNTRTLSTLPLPILDKRREQSSTEGSGDGGDFEEDKGNNGYELVKSFQEKIVVESEDVPLMNTRTLSTPSLPIVDKRREQSSTEGNGDGGDFEEDKGNSGYESVKSFQEKIVVESEDVPLMNTRTLSTLSLPIVGKRREQSSTEGSGDGGDFEEDKGNNGYESVKSFQEKIVVESEDVPLTNARSLSTLSLPIVGKRREQSSTEGSGDGGDSEGDKRNRRYESVKSFQEKIVVESEDVSLMNKLTLSTLSLPIVGEQKEQSSAGGSGILFKSGQELSSSEKPKSKIGKAKGTTSRLEGGVTNRSKCEVM